MKFIKTTLLIAIIVLLNSGCYASMSGTVIDAKTEKPIEGAVVLVEWTYTSGKWIGLRSTSSYKVIEKVTDKEGKFKVSGVLNPFVNHPTIVVYKKGYVAWRNDFIFPDYKKREDFQWKNGYIFKLEHFKKSYSHSQHIFFFQSDMSLTSSSKLEQAFAWEIPFARKEEELLREKRKAKQGGKYTEEDIWEEIIKELYFHEGENISE